MLLGESTEPGSTFKLASLMVALEDGVIDTGDIVDTGNGSVKFYNKVIRDTKEERLWQADCKTGI